MMHAISESDMTSLETSSAGSPKRPAYYVQSPSRDSHDDGDKSSSSMQPTPAFNSPMESPSHPSAYGRHSRASSASRVSGNYSGTASSSSSWLGRKARDKRAVLDKGWPEGNVIDEEEEDYDDLYGRKDGVSRRCQLLIGLSGFLGIFSVFCLIIWGASRPFKPQVTVKSLIVHNFYIGQGSDFTGVPTKMLTINCSVEMNVYNPATFFGIHVSAVPVNLMYLAIIAATGELTKYYQPRKSNRTVFVNLEGAKVPLYGAGASLAASDDNGGIPMALVFVVRSRGNVVGKLVKSRHRRPISCSLVIDSVEVDVLQLEQETHASIFSPTMTKLKLPNFD